jgi:hypothetical protein
MRSLGISVAFVAWALSDARSDLRDQRRTDWPSYVASQCRSIRQFENEFLCIDVRALNQAELFYEASVRPKGEPDISLHVTLNRHEHDNEIGRQLVKLVDVASRWDENAR